MTENTESPNRRVAGRAIVLIAIMFLGAVLWWVLRGMPLAK